MRSLRLPNEVEVLLQDFFAARDAAAGWTKEVKRLRAQLDAILETVGYNMDRSNLGADGLEGLAGETTFEVRPSDVERLDQDLLKRKYPEAYLACLKKTTSYRVVQPSEGTPDE